MSGPSIPDATRYAQDQATDPAASAWVSANAGAGKTFVLARRVLRLLLEGYDPASLLCLTFTKAAAAEMATRVFDALAGWTRLDDRELDAALADLGSRAGARERAAARSLFARALETPGGLKIQTIHAFCESLLHQFPFEANVAASFQVLDDRDADALMQAARDTVIAEAAADDGALGAAFDHLVAEMADASLADTLDRLLKARHTLIRAFDAAGTVTVPDRHRLLIARHAALMGLEELDGAMLHDALADPMRHSPHLPRDKVAAYWERARQGTATDRKRIEPLWLAHTADTPHARRAAYQDGLFTASGGLRATGPKSLPRVAETFPEVLDAIAAEQERALALRAHQDYAALMRVALRVLDRFEALKARRGALDFDDLIARTAALLTRSDAQAWVRYKLDQKIDHVLVDEAQDTSAQQWAIIRALADDFFDGEAARDGVQPTFFAVGDEKQSIYSFQGADPRQFDATRRTLETKAANANTRFEAGVQLSLSFRSTRDVLSAVDTVFGRSAALQGVSLDTGLVHEPFRAGRGQVEIWPVIKGIKTEEPADWTAPVDSLPAPHVRLAEAIAMRVERLLTAGQAPGDVLILLRTRGAMADAINRALKTRGVAVAGADRLTLTDHIAVEDMMALMQAVLLPEDDLSLATLLTSPLIGLTDTQMEALCAGRPGFLIDRLNAPTDTPAIRQAALNVRSWRAMADYASPFTFLATVLGRDGGMKRMLARLGEDARDPLDELLRLALAEETRPGGGLASLETFLDTLRRLSLEIKRDMEARADKVRIMTVHGSKGLEAKTVFLVDTCRLPKAPTGILTPEARDTEDAVPPLVLLRGTTLAAPYRAIKQAEADRQMEEYRRLLYVAMTRARDQLIVTGHMPGDKQVPEGCWYDLIDTALRPDARDVGALETVPDEAVKLWRADPWPQTSDDQAEPLSSQLAVPQTDIDALRAAATEPLTEPRPATPLRPSKALSDSARTGMAWHEAVLDDRHRRTVEDLQTVSPALSEPDTGTEPESIDPRAFGTLVHTLLEADHLPDEAERRRIAQTLGLDASMAGYDAMLIEAGRQIAAVHALPDAAQLFGASARAEVPLRGQVMDAAGNARDVTGTIDRLVLLPDAVWAIDFKTNGRPPAALDLPRAVPDYVAQMALYEALLARLFPKHAVRCGLLWTAAGRLDWLDPAHLQASRQALGVAGDRPHAGDPDLVKV